MNAGVEIGIAGCAIHAPQGSDSRSLEESIYAVTWAALRDAGFEIEDIEGIVVAGNDELDGRAISVMAASGSVGGVDRDILSTPSAAEHAFVLGALRIASGQFATQLVVAWNDPYWHRALPQDELAAHGLQAGAVEHAMPGIRKTASAIVRKNRVHGAMAYPDRPLGPVEKAFIAAGKPTRWPLTDTMVCPPGFGLVAMVLAERATIASRKIEHVAWIRGMGWATEPGFLGDRDLSRGNGLADMSTVVAILLGTTLGAALSGWWPDRPLPIGLLLVALAVLGALASLFIARVPDPDERRPMHWLPWAGLADGWRRLRGDRPLLLAVIGIGYFWFAGALLQLDVILLGLQDLALDAVEKAAMLPGLPDFRRMELAALSLSLRERLGLLGAQEFRNQGFAR